MAISVDDVSHVARLARLALSGEEIRLFQEQLGRILKHMEELNSLKTDDVPPTAHILGLTNVLRDDEPRVFENRNDLLEIAPQVEGPYFKVPKVIE